MKNRYGIVLAGGNGERLRELVYERRGDYLPKQYNNFIGRRSMLEHTFDRAGKLIRAENLFVVINREHLLFKEVRRQIRSRPPGTALVQPRNKETAPGILLALLHVARRDCDAAVAIFPSDHFILEEDVFMRHVELAFHLLEEDRSRIVLLGIKPNCPDTEYGYIVPGEKIGGSAIDGRAVELFVEKPARETAAKIIQKGALWNTLVLIFNCKTMLEIVRLMRPDLYCSFERISAAIGTPGEQNVLKEVYRELRPVNFSTAVLEKLSREYRRKLLVLPVSGVTWSDWGTRKRLVDTLGRMNKLSLFSTPPLPPKRKQREPSIILNSPRLTRS